MKIADIFLKLGVRGENLAELPNFKKNAHAAANAASKLAGAAGKLDNKIKEAGDRIREFLGPVTTIRLQLLAAVGATTFLTERVSKMAFELDKFTKLTGLSAQKLQEWQQMATASNVSAEEMQATIENLNKTAVDISLGRGNIAPWAMLGIDPKQDPFIILDELQKKLKAFPTAIGTKLATDIGLGENMINFLKEAKSLAPADKSLLLSDKEINKLKEFNILFNRIWDNAKRTLQKFGVIAQPIAEFVLKAFDRMNKAFMDGIRAIQWLTDRFKSIGPIIGAIAVAVAAYFFPVTAALIATAALLEDIASYARGDDSIIGRLIERYKDLKNVIMDVVTALATLADMVTFGAFSKELGDVVGKIADWTSKKEETPKSGFSPIPSFPTSGNAGMTQTNNVNITVSGAGSPEDVANRLERKIRGIKDNNARAMFQMPIGETP